METRATPHPKGGRPTVADRQTFAAVRYELRNGIQWNALPRELGASTTVYDRFRLWERQGVFDRLWQAGLQESSKQPCRWAVERLHSWLNRSRRLLIRREKLPSTYEAFLHLACASSVFNTVTA